MRGFSIFEIAVVLVLAGIVVAGTLTASTSVIDAYRIKSTEKKLEEIENALYNYQISTGNMPCPADLSLAVSSANYGLSQESTEGTCSGTNYSSANNWYGGAVPTRTLGLPDEYMVDGWGNRFDYFVDFASVNNTLFSKNMVLSNSPKFDGPDWFTYAGPTGATIANPLGNYPATSATYIDTQGTPYFNFLFPGKNGYIYIYTNWPNSAVLTGYMLGSTSYTTKVGQQYKVVFDSLASNIALQTGFNNNLYLGITAGSGITTSFYPVYGRNEKYFSVGTASLPYFRFAGTAAAGDYYEMDNIYLYLVNAAPNSNMALDVYDTTDFNGTLSSVDSQDLINGQSIYVLVSHGKNGFGAYPKKGGTRNSSAVTGSTSEYEIENSHVGGTMDGEFRTGPINDTTAAGTRYFDDIVRWKSYENLRYRESLRGKV